MDKDFYQSIFDLVKLIPKGRVCSYGLIAKSLGSPQASRVVGYAMNKSLQVDANIPAHRVVNRLGMLTGKHYFSSETKMQELLEAEGLRIINDQIQDFEKVLWNPIKEISF
jgi:methylated-DNA-protein-cysteine methyltransferase-like protein